MKEDLISLETAKLAKEKGFNLNSPAFYGCDHPSGGTESNKLIWRDWIKCTNIGDEGSPQKGTFIYSAPTQSLLQKWLREKHNIHIGINLDINNLFKTSIIFNDQCEYFGENEEGFKTYEQALEVGLYFALKLI